MNIRDFLFSNKIVMAGGEMRRLILQGAIKLNGNIIRDEYINIIPKDIITVGKKEYTV